MNATTDSAHKMITEEIPVAGNELLARVRALLEEGRVRHIKVKSPTGQVYFELPLGVGLLGGAALAWASPFLAMAGALAGLVSSVKIEVAREPDGAGAIASGMATADTAKAGAKRRATRIVKRAASTAKAATKTPARTVAKGGRAPAKAARVSAKTAKGKAARRGAKSTRRG